MILLSHLSAIDDPRRREGRRFDLAYLLRFTLLTIISGAHSYRAITRFIQVRLDWFKSLTGVRWPGAPSHTGLRKCLLKLDANEIEAALRRHAGDNAESALIAVDGKTLRRSLDLFADKSAVQWISAFAGHEKMCLVILSWPAATKAGKSAHPQTARDLRPTAKLGAEFIAHQRTPQNSCWPARLWSGIQMLRKS